MGSIWDHTLHHDYELKGKKNKQDCLVQTCVLADEATQSLYKKREQPANTIDWSANFHFEWDLLKEEEEEEKETKFSFRFSP